MAKKIFEDGKEVANFEVDFLPSDLPKEKEKEDEEQSRAEESAMEFLKRVAPKFNIVRKQKELINKNSCKKFCSNFLYKSSRRTW